jgi:hypothetical protein
MDHRSFLQLVEQPGGVVVRWDFKPAEDKGEWHKVLTYVEY